MISEIMPIFLEKISLIALFDIINRLKIEILSLD